MEFKQGQLVLPYVYRLTHKETGEFYIGYREANTVKSHIDLPEYRSSSKRVKALGFDNFNWEIVAEFFDGDHAYLFEQELIDENFSDPLCLNRYRITSGNRFKNVGPMSDEAKRNNSLARLGKKLSDEHRANIAKGVTGRKFTEETKKRISNAKMGNKPPILTAEQRNAISIKMANHFKVQSPDGTVYIGTNISKFCHEHELNTGAMSTVCTGKAKHHKGWTGEYIWN